MAIKTVDTTSSGHMETDVVENRNVPPISDDERYLAEIYDPVTPDIYENTAGFIVRAAVDISRYRRGKQNPSADANHLSKLEKATVTQVTARLAAQAVRADEMEIGGGSSSFIDEVRKLTSELPWERTPGVLIPRISRTLPEVGTEHPFQVSFISQPDQQRAALPA